MGETQLAPDLDHGAIPQSNPTLARQDVEAYALHSLTTATTDSRPPMLTRNDTSLAAPHVRGKLAVVVFVFTLLAFVVESQLTQVSTQVRLVVKCVPDMVLKVCSNESSITTSVLPLVRLKTTRSSLLAPIHL